MRTREETVVNQGGANRLEGRFAPERLSDSAQSRRQTLI